MVNTKVCTGPCGRNLPLTEEYFRRCRESADSFASECKDCAKKAHKDKYNENLEESRSGQRDRQKLYTFRKRLAVISHYGGKCACCGETNLEFLTVDHIDGGGREHRKEIGDSSEMLVSWLIKNDFPPGFQILCSNCNLSKYIGGVCVHRRGVLPAAHDKPIAGIDIGLSGAVAIIDGNRCVSLWDMPTFVVMRGKKKVTEYNIAAMNEMVNEVSRIGATVYMEKAQILPRGFTIKGNVGLARCQGLFEGLLSGNHVKFIKINPKTWQSEFGISGAKGDTKIQSVKAARQMFPDSELVTPRGRVLDGRADAILIAEYGKRHENES